ncbi:hypoxanthine phosphoribosyltransferase [bacterium]|nr:MAG: hypoxanthine phosphoribosyltransferase [bacterium]
MPPHQIIISEEQIGKRIPQLAGEVEKELGDENPLVVVVLKGAFVFASDLVRNFEFPHQIDFIATSSYGDATSTSGVVKLLKDLDEPIKGRTILLVEDIVDTGLTLHYLQQLLQIRQPKKIEVMTFLSKMARREFHTPLKFVGFEIPDKFVVGYGLDYKEQYRGLPYVIAIEE